MRASLAAAASRPGLLEHERALPVGECGPRLQVDRRRRGGGRLGGALLPRGILALLELLGGDQGRNQQREHAEGEHGDPDPGSGTRLLHVARLRRGASMPHAKASSVTAVDSHIQSTPAATTNTTKAPAQPAAAPAGGRGRLPNGATSAATSSAPKRDRRRAGRPEGRSPRGLEVDRVGVAHRVRPARRAVPLELERAGAGSRDGVIAERVERGLPQHSPLAAQVRQPPGGVGRSARSARAG